MHKITRKAHGTKSGQSISGFVSLLSLLEILQAAWSLPYPTLLYTSCLEKFHRNPGHPHHIRQYLQFLVFFQNLSKKIGIMLIGFSESEVICTVQMTKLFVSKTEYAVQFQEAGYLLGLSYSRSCTAKPPVYRWQDIPLLCSLWLVKDEISHSSSSFRFRKGKQRQTGKENYKCNISWIRRCKLAEQP